jgi:drug/metabolite transporter (DMT)-like permease
MPNRETNSNVPLPHFLKYVGRKKKNMLRASVLAGLNASLASVAGKIAFDERFLVSVVFHGIAPSSSVLLVSRALAVVVLLALNALLFRFVAVGMSKSASSVEVTAVVCAVNFLFSGLFGWLLFGETLSWLWFVGASLLAVGVALLH